MPGGVYAGGFGSYHGSGPAGGGGGYDPFEDLPEPPGGGGGGGGNSLYDLHHNDPNWHEGNGPFGWGATPGGGGGSGGGGSAAPPRPSELTLDAKANPYLEELVGRQRGYLDSLEGGTGRIMDIAGSRLRDAREGGRKALQNSAAFRGVDDGSVLSSYDAETTRGVQSALADITTDREALLGNALQGSLGIYSAPGEDARAQNAQALQAWQANNDANMGWWNASNMVGQQNFENWATALELQSRVLDRSRMGVPVGY